MERVGVRVKDYWDTTNYNYIGGCKKGEGALGPTFYPFQTGGKGGGSNVWKKCCSNFCWLKKIKGICWVSTTFYNFKRGGKVEGSSFWTKKCFLIFWCLKQRGCPGLVCEESKNYKNVHNFGLESYFPTLKTDLESRWILELCVASTSALHYTWLMFSKWSLTLQTMYNEC